MDDLIKMARIVQHSHRRWLDVITPITSPENVARQQRLEQLDVEIKDILKIPKVNTQGHIDAKPIKALVKEQSRLEEEVERDTKLYKQQLIQASTEIKGLLIGVQSNLRSVTILEATRRCAVRDMRASVTHPEKESDGNAGENDNDDGDENDRVQDDHHSPQYTFDVNQREEIPQAKRNSAFVPSNTPAITSPEPDHSDEQSKEPLQTPDLTSMRSGKKRKRAITKVPACQWKPPNSFVKLDPRIINLKPDEIVSVWCKNHFEPAMILPWGRSELFDYDHTLYAVKLNKKIPSCYDSSQSDDMTPRPWAPGYENEGDLAHRRKIPGLYFGKEEDFPVGCKSDWISLNKLKMFDEACSHTINKEAVLEWIGFCAKPCPQEQDESTDSILPNGNKDL